MDNIYTSDEVKEFYVWINPKDIYAHHNALIVGSFVSLANKDDNLMFLPNKHFSGFISPFQSNLLRSYQAEYNLEIIRKKQFEKYPSRLAATFLFENEEEAMKYKKIHYFHVGDRIMKVGKTVGSYVYSQHDLSWIDYLRSPLIIDDETRQYILESYWKGTSVREFKLPLMEKSLFATAEPNYEILYIGRIDFK